MQSSTKTLLLLTPLALALPATGAEVTSSPILESHRVLRTWTGTAPTELMGFKTRDVGDVDGDGIRDFAVAATGRDNGALERAGAIDVYSTGTGRRLHSYPGHLARGSFGNGIGPAGDVDGDGVADIVGGAFTTDDDRAGYAVVFSAATGMTHHVLRSGTAGDEFGVQVHGTGDLDGDGNDDVVVGAPGDDSAGAGSGRAYFFSGRTGEVLFILEGERPGDAFGSAVAGDVHDRSGLFAVGAREAGPDRRGRIYVYRMHGGRPALVFTVEPLEASQELGAYFLSFLGDVDADGTPDLYASDFADSGDLRSAGRVRVISGRTGDTLLNLAGRTIDGGFGTGYGRVGDVDRDGHADVLVGAWRDTSGAEAGGSAFLYSGRDGRPLATFTGRLPGRTFGHDAIGIGDANEDGVVDLLITNAGNSGVLPRAVGHVYLFSGSDGAGDGKERDSAEPATTASAPRRDDQPLAVVRPSDSPSWSPDGARITYSTWINGDWEIASIRVDGSAFARLTRSPGLDDSPTWSPDGRWIAFTSQRDGDQEIYRMRPDGSDVQRLTEMSGAVARPSFSPDGRRLVFNAVTADGTREIFVTDVEGGAVSQLTDAPGHSDWPWWSADGETIHFESDRSGVWQIYSMRPDGSGLRQLTRGSDASAAPVSSPTGDLVVGHARRGDWEIVTWGSDGTETNVTRHPAEDRMPAWSPDGERIAFISDRSGPFEIFVVDADGSNPRQLTRQEPGAVDIVRELREAGVEAATALFDRLRERFPDRPLFEERAVNAYGYELLGRRAIGEAIAVFRLNVRAFPDSGNVHDSLGEALGAAGRTAESIASYAASLERDPGNDNARRVLAALTAGVPSEIPHDSADWVPDVSPDGRWIAYTTTPEGIAASEIAVAAVDGASPRRLTENGARDERPRWSPDGRHLVFQSDRDGQWELYLFDLDSGEEHRLTTDSGDDQRPDFSPDGRFVVFDSDRTGDIELYELELARPSSITRLTESAGRDAYATYSPNGDRIALTSDRDGDAEIFVLGRDGSTPLQLTANDAMDQAPRWSPDGASLVFFSNRDGNPEIYRMAADGSRQLRLTFSPDWDFMPDFAPDGRTIVFDSRRTGRRGLYAMEIDGSTQRQLSNRSVSPFVAAVGAGDEVARAALHLPSESPRALEPELAVTARRVLASDPDLAFALTLHWLRAYPFTPARETWVDSHLALLLPLVEARATASPKALVLLAIAAAKLDRPEAAEILEQAAAANPDDPAVLALREAFVAETLVKQALADGAASRLDTLLTAEKEARPSSFGPVTERRLNALGYQLLGAGEVADAVAVFRANAAAFPDSANVWDSLGEALWRSGRSDDAIRHYERSLDLDPGNGNARTMIHRIRAKLN